MSNKKITDLDLVSPIADHRFLVATEEDNFQIPYSGISADITGELGPKIDDLYDKIDIVSGIAMDNREEFRAGFAATQQTHFYFSDIRNTRGPIIHLYDTRTPTADVIEEIHVNDAASLRVGVKWDGPFSDYLGSAYIQNRSIPFANIKNIGEETRRFSGHLYAVNATSDETFYPRTGLLSGFHLTNWDANNGRAPYQLISSGSVQVVEYGPGPMASNITIDTIDNAIPKQGHVLGTDSLKEDDEINIFIDYEPENFDHPYWVPTGIEVIDDGLAKPIPSTNYPMVDIGGGVMRATIRTTVSNRNGSHGVSIRSISQLGTTGLDQSSTHFPSADSERTLDQAYPVISFTTPVNFNNGRLDGLREDERIDLDNNILNWDATQGDTVSYTVIPTNEPTNPRLSIANPDLFENPKSIGWAQGIKSEEENLNIYAVRASNGATSSENISVKIANAPSISGTIVFPLGATSTAPYNVGTTAAKGGDTVNVVATIDTKLEPINSIDFKVYGGGISDGSQVFYSSTYTSDPANYTVVSSNPDIYQVNIPVSITPELIRNGLQSVAIQAINQYGIESDTVTSINDAALGGSATLEIDNTFPTLSINQINYPAGQQALKIGESASLETSAANYDTVLYEDLNGQLSITDPDIYEIFKNIDYLDGDYNVTDNNLKITISKTTNGTFIEQEALIKIANKPLEFTLDQFPAKLRSGPAGNSYVFKLTSDQLLNDIPSFSLDPNHINAPTLSVLSAGTDLSSNEFEVTVFDSNTKGEYDIKVTGYNLANIETTGCTPDKYIAAGFIARMVEAPPATLLGGLCSIGTYVSGVNDVVVENLSEAGYGPNGGTIYSFYNYNKNSVDFSLNVEDSFIVCDADGSINDTGNHFFNADALSRASNADTNHPAKFIIEEL